MEWMKTRRSRLRGERYSLLPFGWEYEKLPCRREVSIPERLIWQDTHYSWQWAVLTLSLCRRLTPQGPIRALLHRQYIPDIVCADLCVVFHPKCLFWAPFLESQRNLSILPCCWPRPVAHPAHIRRWACFVCCFQFVCLFHFSKKVKVGHIFLSPSPMRVRQWVWEFVCFCEGAASLWVGVALEILFMCFSDIH